LITKLFSYATALVISIISLGIQAKTVTEYIECKSKDKKFKSCPIETDGDIIDVSIDKKISGTTSCRGKYGVAGKRVTVDDGCRAVFAVEVEVREYRPHATDPDLEWVTINCSSFENEKNKCFIGEGIQDMYLIEQLSRSSCKQSVDDWGSDYSSVWVDNGCRAKFDILR